MNNSEIYMNSINQIFDCLDKLDQYLESEDNSSNVKNLNEYKEIAISFYKLMSEGQNANNNPVATANTSQEGDQNDG
jgi:hypothetical protein